MGPRLFGIRWWLWAAAMLFTALSTSDVAAQGNVAVDTIAGRVTAPDSTPIASARVSATGNDGSTRLVRTDTIGRYLLTVPNGSGRYLLSVAAFGYAPFSVDVEVAPGTRRVERNLRLNPRVVVLDTLTATAGVMRILGPQKTPGEESAEWSSLLSENLPLEQGELANVAAFQPGVLRLGETEFSIAGQPPSQNRITVDGASYGGVQLPSEGVRSIAVVSDTYDPARGQFSGGEIAARTISGTNLWGGALSARLEDPTLQYGGVPGGGFGQPNRRLRLSGGGGGPLVRDRLFVYGAADLSRNSGDRTLLDPADPAALRRISLAPDSARRFADIAQRLGLYPGAPRVLPDATRDFGSALARIDYTLSKQHSLTGRLDWRGSRSSGLGTSPFRLASTGGELRSTDIGLLAQVTSAWGFWANEFRTYHSAGTTTAGGESSLPAGRVRVTSALDDGTAGVSLLDFGGTSLLPERERSLWEVADELVRETEDGAHRFKGGVLLQEERFSRSSAQNRFGTFRFNSLADLERGRPASFTRTFAREPDEVVARYGAVYAADTWRVSDALRLIGGLRLEGARYGARAALASAVDSLVEGRRGEVPAELLLSPRLGFTYAIPGRGRVSLHGGVGRFRGTAPLPTLAGGWGETGGGDGETRLVCVGPAAPVPDWRAYADPTAIPTACADGSSVFANRAPPVTFFADDFAAPRTWRASLDVRGSLTARSGYSVGGLLARGTRIPTALDRNRSPDAAFALSDEAGRPVYVGPDAVDPASGGIAPDALRLDPALGPVREIGARGESRTGQLTAHVHGIAGKNTLWGVSYALTRSQDLAGGVPVPGSASTTSGDPARLEWASTDWEQRHLFQFLLNDRLTRRIRLSAIGWLASGLPFTPRVAGDVNGDGFSNDRAFVFDPRVVDDATVARGMARLLEEGPGPAGDCLRRQLGRIAKRNSCRTPRTPFLDVRAELRPLGPSTSRALTLSITASNVTAGFDYLLHGPDGLRGWGQYPLPDATLLEVRGFDPERRTFRYDVNPNFGERLGGGIARIPFKLTLEGRVTVGADPRYQPMARAVEAGRASFGGTAKIRAGLAERIRNVPAVILALNASEPETLGLTPDQADRLRPAADSLGPQIEAALDSLADALTQPGPLTAARRAAIQGRSREAQRWVEAGLRVAQEILTPEQWAQLPRWLTQPPGDEELEHPSFEAPIPIGGP